MNTEQIIKALECCINFKTTTDCLECPSLAHCEESSSWLDKEVLALIKSQQGEIRGLNSAIEILQGIAKDYEHRNENLQKENKYLRERLAEEAEIKEDMEGV